MMKREHGDSFEFSIFVDWRPSAVSLSLRARRGNPFFLYAEGWIASAFAKATADKSLRSQ